MYKYKPTNYHTIPTNIYANGDNNSDIKSDCIIHNIINIHTSIFSPQECYDRIKREIKGFV